MYGASNDVKVGPGIENSSLGIKRLNGSRDEDTETLPFP
jgi:hypothetical protein